MFLKNKSTYILQIATLMSGTLIAQVITLAFIPIITRLYTPSEFGVYALFMTLSSIVGLVSSLKYDQAIMLPKQEIDAQAIVFLSVLITSVITLLSIIAVLVFYDLLLEYFLGNSTMIVLLPIGILLVGLLQIFNAYSSRKQYYKELSIVKVYNSSIIVGVQSTIRYLLKLDGLVIGKILGDVVSLFLLLKLHIKKQTLQLKQISKNRMIVNAAKYNSFPKYQSTTVFMSAISQSLPVLLFASLYSPEIAGFYSLAIRMLQVPVGLIGSSTREVYYQKASKMYAAGESIFLLYKKTTLGLIKIFILPFIIIVLFGDILFNFIFGSEWLRSGEFSQVMIFWIYLLFINSPSVATYSILNMQNIQMKLEIISITLRFLSIYIGFYFFNSFLISIFLYVFVSFCINLFAIIYIYIKLKSGRDLE